MRKRKKTSWKEYAGLFAGTYVGGAAGGYGSLGREIYKNKQKYSGATQQKEFVKQYIKTNPQFRDFIKNNPSQKKRALDVIKRKAKQTGQSDALGKALRDFVIKYRLFDKVEGQKRITKRLLKSPMYWGGLVGGGYLGYKGVQKYRNRKRT